MKRAALLLLVAALGACSHPAGWQRVEPGTAPGDVAVSIHRSPELGTIAYRGVIEVQQDPATVLLALADFAHYPDWLFRCRAMEVRPDAWGPAHARVIINGLGPVAGRDIVLRNRIELEPTTRTLVIRSRTVEGVVPHADGLVRMPELANVFRERPRDNGRTEVTFRTAFDAGRHLPERLLARVARRVPETSLTALADRLENERYQLQNLDSLPLTFAQLRALLLSRGEEP